METKAKKDGMLLATGKISLLIATGLLFGCQHSLDYQGQAQSIDNSIDLLKKGVDGNKKVAENPIPPSVMSALAPQVHQHLKHITGVKEKRIDVAVRDIPANEFLMSLVGETDYDISVPDSVRMNVSLSLKQASVPEIMEYLHNTYGIEYNVTKKGYEVIPMDLVTRTYAVDYLVMTRKGSSTMKVDSTSLADSSGSSSSGSISNNSTTTGGVSTTASSSQVSTESVSDFWGNVQESVKAILGKTDGASVVTNPQASLIIVHASNSQHKAIREYLDSLQKIVNRQVVLDVKILEVILNNQYQAGIDWSAITFFGSQNGSKKGVFNMLGANTPAGSGSDSKLNPVNLGTDSVGSNIGLLPSGLEKFVAGVDNFGAPFNGVITLGQFAGLMQFLEGQGNVQVLSSPRISTINNQKAIIKVGVDQYFITGISNTQTTTGTTASNTPSVSTAPFFSGIALDVTPQISASGDVRLHVHPSVSSVTASDVKYTYSDNSGNATNQTLPLPINSIRESDSVIVAKNGQLVVIGGLMKNNSDEVVSSMPVVGDIPYVGALFRQTRQNQTKSELVILIKPSIMTDNDWVDELANTHEKIKGMKRGFHLGTNHDVFGAAGELGW